MHFAKTSKKNILNRYTEKVWHEIGIALAEIHNNRLNEYHIPFSLPLLADCAVDTHSITPGGLSKNWHGKNTACAKNVLDCNQ